MLFLVSILTYQDKPCGWSPFATSHVANSLQREIV
jgi:hypothetical protein